MPSFTRNFIRYHGILPGLLLGITLQFSPDLFGEELPAVETAPPVLLTPETVPKTPTADIYDSWESSRDYLSGKITSFASDIDRFFGGDRHFQESNDSVLQLDLTKLSGYGTDNKVEFDARMNLRLPVTEGRLRLLVETAPEKNIITATTPLTNPVAATRKAPAKDSVALALRYAKEQKGVWHFSSDWGIQFPIPPRPFARTRLKYSVPMGEWQLKAEESVYWFNTEGLGETTQLYLEHIISPPMLFRSSTIVTWLRDYQTFDILHNLTLYQTINDRSALLYQTSLIGIGNPHYETTDLAVLMSYRYRMHQEWLFFEISPQLHFPIDRQYQISPVLSLRLEVLFDDSRRY